MTQSENENDHFDLDHFDHLKELREANDLTQEQMSSYLGIGHSAYANYEACEREPPLEVLDSAYSIAFPKSTPLNVSKKRRT